MRALIFDMDGTLYQNRLLAEKYDESLYAYVAAQKNIPFPEAKKMFAAMYGRLQHRCGRPPSKLYTLTRLKLSDTEWARRHGARVYPGKILRPDHRLRKTLMVLRDFYRLAIVTNNHQKNMQATLRALRIEGLFDETLTLSESRIFKPSPGLYLAMARRLAVEPQACLSIGDRYDLDLAPAAAAGMQTLWVQNRQDIYRLPQVLQPLLAKQYTLGKTAAPGNAVMHAVRALRNDSLVVIPTDTVYGLAGACRERPIQWMYRAKGREEKKPLPLLLSDASQASCYAEVSKRARELMVRHWPGALTLVLPVKKGARCGKLTRGQGTVALRVPDHALARHLIRKAGGALAVTSANCSGEPAPVFPGNISKKILAFSEVLLDAGKCQGGVHSTVVQIRGPGMKVLREGGIAFEKL
ncbi:threonylcarbamoyl-AMP synthase [candidate division FCPU426 bacterium]|nr:threonylcarbamoyl-AMP synthase [candidate division FCPU426 bacterium]